MDEIKMFAEHPPPDPAYPQGAKSAARGRLLEEAAGNRRRFAFPRAGWQAVAAFGVTVALVGGVTVGLSLNTPAPTRGSTGGGDAMAGAVVATPYTGQTGQELEPKPGQYVVVESETMFVMESKDADRQKQPDSYLYRTKRRTWQSYDGSAPGLLRVSDLPPQQFADRPLPPRSQRMAGRNFAISPDCAHWPEGFRPDYAYLSTLPTDGAMMREVLYKRVTGDVDREVGAFTQVRELVTENYLPRPQRTALFEAVMSLPGVERTEGVKDGDGREGVAFGMVSDGVNHQLVFDPQTFMFLGERQTAASEKNPHSVPVGTVLGLSTQQKISVADELPKVENVLKDSTCEMGMPPATDGPVPATDGPTPAPMTAPEQAPAPASTDPAAPKGGATPIPNDPMATKESKQD
ncbi:hypothetical protein SAMN05421505_110170 [Sinosporangium album]|uniref:CU044_5270 family protein n=1 Tax=Sinosporangium album TaxID=504805 RepID=A0A1G7Z4K7_9ACTN|nr:CU044_5270 family protein [Sinosporangium album]SDH03080.1 hypothetical protein SAMN05421505_110170 [Sinosporangium album]